MSKLETLDCSDPSVESVQNYLTVENFMSNRTYLYNCQELLDCQDLGFEAGKIENLD
jgi:hypothetical protein